MLARDNKIVSNENTSKKYVINPKITTMKQSYIKSMSDSALIQTYIGIDVFGTKMSK